ncbi:Helicase associated domain protein [Streptomyces sp. NPDC004111]|uniref:DEAD/DEAH box helicase n=1 Tax=Streptomyces sp. NPDC004111 TaxID=3364690 RepID=UPI0036CD93D8
MRPHQEEAVDAALRHLQLPAGSPVPEDGLRCQVIAATGSGKTRIAAVTAQRLHARRVLVLVPTLDLLTQMAAEWRRAGRGGAMVGACSLAAWESGGIPCTTNPAELLAWAGGEDTVTVFSTYASASTTVQRAHELGMGAFDLMVVDEAHRTSGDASKPWAAVHDQAKIPAVRRLYMTATPRIWEAAEDARRGGREAPRLLANMTPDSSVFGPVAWKLTLSQAISRGLIAPYQVICVDIRDPELHAAQASGDRGSDLVRGARLAALQAGLVTAAADENLRKTLAFHSRVAEAEAMAEGLPAVAARLFREDPKRYHPPERVWASWLYGEHKPGHRRAVLTEFESDVTTRPKGRAADGDAVSPAMLKVVSSVKILGEGLDLSRCDSVAFCDARGSMVDIVQMVGRALRMQPGEGKIASLVVPVFIGPGEEAGEMVVSPGTETLGKVLQALRAHDTDTVEALADPRVRSGSWEPETPAEAGDEVDQEQPGGEALGPSAPARELLKFSTPRDPAEVARFLALRVLYPETAFWRSGITAAARYVRDVAEDRELRVPYDFVTPDDWTPAGFPLGTWLRNQRVAHGAKTLEPERVRELERLGVVWSHQDRAFEQGLVAARHWAAEHGHFLPPANAVWDGYPVGTWAKNLRTAARLADARLQELEDAGVDLTDDETGGGLSWTRREALDAIDPGWCPAWDAGWQRCLRLVQNHLKDGGTLPMEAGVLVVQGEDLGRWVQGCRLGWDRLQPAQQWLLELALGLGPADVSERPVKRTQDDKWATNLTAAKAFHAREGHLVVSRKHVEHLESADGSAGAQSGAEGVVGVRLGSWLDNVRKREDKLTPERRAQLDALGMRWSAGTARRSK